MKMPTGVCGFRKKGHAIKIAFNTVVKTTRFRKLSVTLVVSKSIRIVKIEA